jgi:threonine/homoserine/homoserine lactone efflux protein
MEYLYLFVQGLGVGLAIAAPVGPVGVLCISRTLRHGIGIGLASGLGAAAADGVYGAVAGFGVSWVAEFLLEYQDVLRVLGGLFLLALGARILTRGPAHEASHSERSDSRPALAFTSCFLLTLTNPMTILAFLAVFAGLGLVEATTHIGTGVVLVLGVLLGSAFWWLALSAVVALLRGRVTPPILVWVNRISGAILTGFGLGALLAFLL